MVTHLLAGHRRTTASFPKRLCADEGGEVARIAVLVILLQEGDVPTSIDVPVVKSWLGQFLSCHEDQVGQQTGAATIAIGEGVYPYELRMHRNADLVRIPSLGCLPSAPDVAEARVEFNGNLLRRHANARFEGAELPAQDHVAIQLLMQFPEGGAARPRTS